MELCKEFSWLKWLWNCLALWKITRLEFTLYVRLIWLRFTDHSTINSNFIDFQFFPEFTPPCLILLSIFKSLTFFFWDFLFFFFFKKNIYQIFFCYQDFQHNINLALTFDDTLLTRKNSQNEIKRRSKIEAEMFASWKVFRFRSPSWIFSLFWKLNSHSLYVKALFRCSFNNRQNKDSCIFKGYFSL